MGAENIWK